MKLKSTGLLLVTLFLVTAIAYGQAGKGKFGYEDGQPQSDSTLLGPPWNQATFSLLNDSGQGTYWLKSFVSDPLFKRTRLIDQLELNPHLLFATAHKNNSGNNYFIHGGGGNLRYQHTNDFVFDASFVVFRQSGSHSDSLRTSKNLLKGTYYSKRETNGYSALDVRLNATYKPSRFFQISAGIDNHFVGDGYHSVILGGQAPPNPYGQLSTSFWKIDYNVGYHFLSDVAWPDLSSTYRKYMTTHQLNVRLHPKFHVYVYEAVVWKQEDSIAQRGYDLSYLNPVIFFRPVEFQLGSPSPDNVLLGMGFRWQLSNWTRVYGQTMLDEFYLEEITSSKGWWANKYAVQLGVKNHFNMGDHAFTLIGEFNMARPFTYSHIGSMQNYGNRYTPLAHPLGANFGEFLFIMNWHWKRFRVLTRVAYAQVGQGDEVNYGQNIYRSYTDRQAEYGHNWLQGKLHDGFSGDIRLSYIVNPEMNLNVSLGVRKAENFDPTGFNSQEIYLRLSSFLTSGMKQIYRTR